MPDAYSLHRDGDCNSYSCPVCAQECQHERRTKDIVSLGLMSTCAEDNLEVHAHITHQQTICADCGELVSESRYPDPHAPKEHPLP